MCISYIILINHIDRSNIKKAFDLHCFLMFIIADVPRGRIYWMKRGTDDLKSALYNGSFIRTVFKTYSNWGIVLNDDFIFCASDSQILKINKFQGQKATVVHNDTHQIYGVVFVKQEGKITRITMITRT